MFVSARLGWGFGWMMITDISFEHLMQTSLVNATYKMIITECAE